MTNSMLPKLIKNDWCHDSGAPFASAKILDHKIHPEGVDVQRLRFVEAGSFTFTPDAGHLVSIVKGSGALHLASEQGQVLHVEGGVHLYLPPGSQSLLEAKAGTELLHVSSITAEQTWGKKLLLRDEKFLSACASGSQLLRWVFTPQYLSRRIFLQNDATILSKSGNPVSWFRTTMFDVTGLPKNEEGESVFKMSYNSRTEFNVCYDVEGVSRVRMAKHPYVAKNQEWTEWMTLDSDSTYHLNEPAGGPEEEHFVDEATQTTQFLRNRHEVYIQNGYVSLFCMFDPAPAGIERHRPGEYSDYEPISTIVGTPLYENYQRELKKYDEMVDQLSLAKATGELDKFHGTPLWELYIQGRNAQIAIETELTKSLKAQGQEREKVLARWMQSETA